MGLLDSLFGSSTDSTSTGSDATAAESATDGGASKQKYAILLNAGPDDTPTAGNAFNYALELDDAGYEVGIYLDGEATKWPGEYADNPDRPFGHDWQQVRERGLLVGACGYCANAFEAAQACTTSDVRLLSDGGEHAPSVSGLADEGYELLTIG